MKRTMWCGLMLWTAVGTVAGALALAAPARADQWERTFKLTGKPELRIDTNDGAIEVASSSAAEIHVRVWTSGWRISSDEVRITREAQEGNRVEVEVRVPRSRWSWGFSSIHRDVRVEVTVPREANMDLHTGDGHMTVRGVSGEIRLDTGDGSLTTDDLRGNLRFHTGDGHIDGTNLDGSLDADTGDGHMRIRGRFDGLRLRTGDGSITAEAVTGSKMHADWSVTTGDGSIRLRLPDGFAASVDLHTGDGAISSQLPITVSGSLNKTTMRGQINGGGATLVVRTGDGSIRIERV
jgi:DUF4097 and DUF4098 domain-containing protein YvlB